MKETSKYEIKIPLLLNAFNRIIDQDLYFSIWFNVKEIKTSKHIFIEIQIHDF